MLQPLSVPTSLAISPVEHRIAGRQTAGCPRQVVGQATALATATALAALVARSPTAKRSQWKRLVALRAEAEDPLLAEAKAAAAKAKPVVDVEAGGEDPLLAEARAAAEAAKLQLEAAKLRAEAEAIKEATTLASRESRAARLLGSRDAAGIGLAELMVRMEEIDMKISGDNALRLATALGKLEEPMFFTFQDLASAKFDDELKKIGAEAEAQKAAERAREQQAAQAAQQASQSTSQYNVSTNTEVNDDRSSGTAIGAILPYIYPVVTAMQFAIPLFRQFPGLELPFIPFSAIFLLLNQIPLGQTLVFIAFVIGAQQLSLPRLLRFNLEQAVLLNIAQIIPALGAALFESSGNQEGVLFFTAICFFANFFICVYCAWETADGKYPDGIPGISNATKGIIDQQTGPYIPPDENKPK